MNLKHIFICFFSLAIISVPAQTKKDSVKSPAFRISNVMVGLDVLNAGLIPFSDRKLMQGFVSAEIKPFLHAVADVGFEKNKYQKNGYDATANGPFVKLGAFYMLSSDRENRLNGFYAGAKVAGSFYSQEYFAVPVRGFGGGSSTVAYPASSQSSFWLEGSIGGRVQLFESSFYIDVNAQPKYLLYSSTQDDLKPMIVPGFGKSAGKFSMGFSWNLAYAF